MSKIVTAQIVWLIRVQGSIKVLYLGGGGGGEVWLWSGIIVQGIVVIVGVGLPRISGCLICKPMYFYHNYTSSEATAHIGHKPVIFLGYVTHGKVS